jgi:hypothetical protein
MYASLVIDNLDCGAGDDPAGGINDNAAYGCIGGLRKSRCRSAEDQ